jgi:CarD family transcriptional regulator
MGHDGHPEPADNAESTERNIASIRHNLLTNLAIIDILLVYGEAVHSGQQRSSRTIGRHHLSFKVGDKVVYPNHGVGVIEQVAKRSIGELESSFYCLRILSTDSTVMVPVENTQAVGLRKVLTRREITRVIKALKEGEVTTYDDWKGRFQANSEKMRTGDIKAVAEVLKSLTMLNEIKPLSYRERKMLDRARFLLVSELAEASGKQTEAVETQIDSALSDSLKGLKAKIEH